MTTDTDRLAALLSTCPTRVGDEGLQQDVVTGSLPVARPVTRTVDIRVVIDSPRSSYRWQTEERRIRDLEAWATELEEFVRDHRSQDPISLSVERETETVCDLCERPWETFAEDGETYCAYCGVAAIDRAAKP